MILNESTRLETVPVNTNVQFHCSLSPGSTSAHELEVTEPSADLLVRLAVEDRDRCTVLEALRPQPASPGPSQPEHEPSSLRTVSDSVLVFSCPSPPLLPLDGGALEFDRHDEARGPR